METNLLKLFHSNGHIIDGTFQQPYIHVYPNAFGLEESTLIVNQANPRCDLCEWISEHDIDFADYPNVFRKNVPITLNARDDVNVSFRSLSKTVLDSSLVYESANLAPLPLISADIRSMDSRDLHYFDFIQNDNPVLDIVAQFKDNLMNPCGIECFGLFENGGLAAFAEIMKQRGKLFDDSYLVLDIFTVKPYRQNGLAAALLDNILNKYNGSPFYYDVMPSTNIASVNLARRCGFSYLGKITAYQFR